MISKDDVIMDYFSDIATPLDVLVRIAEDCDWPYERVSEQVLTVDVEGRWAPCTLKFEWLEASEAMRFSIISDLKVSEIMRPRIAELLLDINNKCWMGHFSVTPKAKTIVFSQTCLMKGIPFASLDTMETLVDAGINEFDRFYPMIQGAMVSTSMPANDVSMFSSELFQTMGEA